MLAGTVVAAYSLGFWALATTYLYWQWFYYTPQSYGIMRYYYRQSVPLGRRRAADDLGPLSSASVGNSLSLVSEAGQVSRYRREVSSDPRLCRVRRRHHRRPRSDRVLGRYVIAVNLLSRLLKVRFRTTHQYVEADLDMKGRALEKCKIAEAELPPYRSTDKVPALLPALCQVGRAREPLATPAYGPRST